MNLYQQSVQTIRIKKNRILKLGNSACSRSDVDRVAIKFIKSLKAGGLLEWANRRTSLKINKTEKTSENRRTPRKTTSQENEHEI